MALKSCLVVDASSVIRKINADSIIRKMTDGSTKVIGQMVEVHDRQPQVFLSR